MDNTQHGSLADADGYLTQDDETNHDFFSYDSDNLFEEEFMASNKRRKSPSNAANKRSKITSTQESLGPIPSSLPNIITQINDTRQNLQDAKNLNTQLECIEVLSEDDDVIEIVPKFIPPTKTISAQQKSGNTEKAVEVSQNFDNIMTSPSRTNGFMGSEQVIHIYV